MPRPARAAPLPPVPPAEPLAGYLPPGRSCQPIRVLQLAPWNPRTIGERDFQRLCQSIRDDPAFLLQRPVLVADGPEGQGGRVVYGGNMRTRALLQLYAEGWAPPQPLQDAGFWAGTIPVDVADVPEPVAKQRALQDNNSWGVWDDELLSQTVRQLDAAGRTLDTLGFGDAQLADLLANVAAGSRAASEERGQVFGRRPTPRKGPLDLIFTFASPEHLVMRIATEAGFGIGIRSTDVGPTETGADWPGPVVFVDNEYTAYDHAKHLDVVARFKPKYATVRDCMTREQCERAGIAYYRLDQILRWAEEVAQYAQNVIVVPKWDCTAELPSRYVIGYSVPTSYGGTPLPISTFAGRRIHLLGGSWAGQLSYLAQAGDDVVSLDTNVLAKSARFGSVYHPDGSTVKLNQDLKLPVNNPFTVACAISFGAIARAVRDLYPADARLAGEPEADESQEVPADAPEWARSQQW